jgi:hypothetical protein
MPNHFHGKTASDEFGTFQHCVLMQAATTVKAVDAFRNAVIRPLNPDDSTEDVPLPILKWQVFTILCQKID